MEKTHKLQKTIPDRISNLPDPLIEHIIGFLPVQEAIRTCVLSKRWQHLWNSITQLNFHPFTNPYQWYKTETKYIAFINKALVHFRNSKLIKKVHLWLDNGHPRDRIESWVKFGLRHGVQDFSLRLSDLSPFDKIPDILYGPNSSMQKLTLKYCSFEPIPEVISWVSLKYLSLSYVSGLRNNTMEAIMSGSPVLEQLILYDFECFDDRIRIASTSLKELVIHIPKGTVIEIYCPKLLSLAITGLRISDHGLFDDWFSNFPSINWALLEVSSLVETTIHFDMCSFTGDENLLQLKYSFVDELLQKLKHVTKLTLGSYCLELLSILESCDDLHDPWPILNHKILVLRPMMLKQRDFPGLLRLLEISPSLEKLIIKSKPTRANEVFPFPTYENLNPEENKYGQRKSATQLKCLHSSLKSIEIIGYGKCHSSLSFICELLRLIWENATIEKIIISTGDVTSQSMPVYRLKRLLRVYEEKNVKSVSIKLSIFLCAKKTSK